MTRSTIVGGVSAIAGVIVLLGLAAGYLAREQDVAPVAGSPSAMILSSESGPEAYQGFLYGRITIDGGTTYEGRLRFGGGEEAFWGDYFNGSKNENPWVAHLPPERLTESRPVEVFGVEIAQREHEINFGRPFLARFGDVARIEANGRDLQVTLKSGTVFHLDRFGADDFADGVRVWDDARGVVDLDEWRVRSIELLPTARPGTAHERLYGTVRTRQGDFTGFVQWDREECIGADELAGHTAEGELSLRFDAIRSIARHAHDSSLITLLDGRAIVLSGTRKVGQGNRGVYVDDQRYGRVLISWDAFEHIDFSRRDSGPAYNDFPPGRPLAGEVTTRAGRRLTGRLVFDLDESETTETLDAPSQGVDYTIPFGLIAAVVLPDRGERGGQKAWVLLHSGEDLQLDQTGDLGEGNAGFLVFIDGREVPEYVPWADVEQVEFDRPAKMYPPLGGKN